MDNTSNLNPDHQSTHSSGTKTSPAFIAAHIAQDKFGKVKGFASEFQTFIIKGNAIELAIGVVIGTAFNEVVNSLVKDIILGAIATFAGKPDFTDFAFGAIRWGSFLNTLINLLIVGLSVFVAIKAVNKLTRRELIKSKVE